VPRPATLCRVPRSNRTQALYAGVEHDSKDAGSNTASGGGMMVPSHNSSRPKATRESTAVGRIQQQRNLKCSLKASAVS
jgi:hypothetical protein